MLRFILIFHRKKQCVLVHILFAIPFLATFAFSPSFCLHYHSPSFPLLFFCFPLLFFCFHPCFTEYFKSLSLSVVFSSLSKSHSFFKLLRNTLSFNLCSPSPPPLASLLKFSDIGVTSTLLLHCLLYHLHILSCKE